MSQRTDKKLKHKRPRISLFLIVLFSAMISTRMYAAAWLPYGPDGGDARAFAADPADHMHLYLGAANGWIFQSRDGGQKWERLARVGKRDDFVIDNILVDTADPKHVVVGAWKLADLSHPDGGIFVSTDAGATWTTAQDMDGKSVLALTAAPSDPKIMVAGTMDGVFRSTDSGAHWQQISPKDNKELHEVESIAIDPADPNTIYAGTWHLPWKTTDGGANWKSIKQGLIEDSDVFSIIVDRKQPKTMYLSACSGIYKSVDAGEQFVKAAGIPSSARRTRVLMQDPNQPYKVYAGTTEGLYRTDDAGKAWKETTSPDVIVNDVFVDPTDSKHVLLATDRGGVLASDDGGATFHPSTAGFSTRQIAAYITDAQRPATVYVGVVNDKRLGGVFVSQTGGLNWSQVSSGLGGRDVFSLGQAPDGTVVAGTAHGIFRLKDEMWQQAGLEIKPKPALARKPIRRSARQPPLVAKVSSAVKKARPAALNNFEDSVYAFALSGDTMYAASSQGLLRSESSGVTWIAVDSLPQDQYRFLAASKLNLVAGSLTAAQMSQDGGATWQLLTLPGKVTQISALSVDGDGTVWLGGREGVFFSSDSGANWKNLPDLYLRNPNSIYYDAAANRVLLTATAPSTIAFAVKLPTMQVTSWDTGWDLHFVRQVGDHLVAGTLYDGVVIEPSMAESAEIAKPVVAR